MKTWGVVAILAMLALSGCAEMSAFVAGANQTDTTERIRDREGRVLGYVGS